MAGRLLAAFKEALCGGSIQAVRDAERLEVAFTQPKRQCQALVNRHPAHIVRATYTELAERRNCDRHVPSIAPAARTPAAGPLAAGPLASGPGFPAEA